ncbi:YdcF family protein, partial [Paenibacillus sepulcri]|nr:YdcF family protein [Paenibacillus sepulcri]
LLAAARLHNETGLPIIFSGGQVFKDSGNEADIAKRQLIGLNIPANQIFIDNLSLNTEQNAANVKLILDEQHFENPILVTSAFHMERSVLNFKKSSIDVIAYPVDYWTGKEAAIYANKLTPSSGGLSNTGVALKEYLGIAALKF